MSEDKKGGINDYFQIKEFFGYFFRKKQGTEKPDFSLRSMHFVNKFSIIVFILAIIYLTIKHLF